MPGHPVGGGGIEALSGKEGLGRIHDNDAAVKEQAAAVGIQGGILFDDEERNRNEWNGTAFDVDNIIEILKALN